MDLKILLPFRVFSETKNIKRIVAETNSGSYGLLPHRLDCIAALVPGIFIFETEAGTVRYLALDEGILVKAGDLVRISVRNAIGGADLGKLRESVEKEFQILEENEISNRTVMARMETSFIHNLQKFQKD